MKRLLRAAALLILTLCILVLPNRARADAGDKLVALTFDDGPGPYTERLLDGLKERGVQVTFFMLGSRAEAYPATVARAYEEGHQIANHSYSHAEMTGQSDWSVQNEFQKTAEILTAKSGGASDFITRMPYGSSSARVRGLVNAPIIVWSVDPVDWKYRNAATVRSNITSAVFDGAIILTHDIHATTVDGVLVAIDDLLSRGYEFVTVNELFRRRGVSLEAGVEYYSCKPTGTDLGPIDAPVISGGNLDGKLLVTLTAQTDAPIYYTVDGSSPAVSGQLYTGPFVVPGNTTVRAVAAYHMNGCRSLESSLTLTEPQTNKPVLETSGGRLIITCPDAGATIHYTVDGTDADASSSVYNSSAQMPTNVILHVCASYPGWLDSEQVVVWYSGRGNLFYDVTPDKWYADGIDYAASKNYLQGKRVGFFAPTDPLTRGQLAAIIYRWAGEPAWSGSAPFDDVAPAQYYAAPVAWAYAQGIVAGKSASRFDPDGTVTRQELAAIVLRYLYSRGLTPPADEAEPFADAAKIASWAQEAAAQMRALGLLLGDTRGNFNPTNPCTRAEAAALLTRADALQ